MCFFKARSPSRVTKPRSSRGTPKNFHDRGRGRGHKWRSAAVRKLRFLFFRLRNLTKSNIGSRWAEEIEQQAPWRYASGTTHRLDSFIFGGPHTRWPTKTNTGSFEPEDPRVALTNYILLWVELVKAERIRRKLVPQIQEATAKLQTCQKEADLDLAALSHLGKRTDVFQVERFADIAGQKTAPGLYAQKQVSVHQKMEKSSRLLGNIYQLEQKLADAMSTLTQGEPTIFRATNGFLVHRQEQDYDESRTPRDLRFVLRLAAEYGRSPLLNHNSTGMSGVHSDQRIVLEVADGQYILRPEVEAAMREQNFRDHMATVYRDVEALLVKYGDLPPEEDGVSLPSQAAPNGSADIQRTKAEEVLKKLEAGRREYDAAMVWLEELHYSYAQERVMFMLTYRDPFGHDPEGDAQPNSPQDIFDREYMARQIRATRRVRAAILAVWEARNQALEHKVADPEEPQLFGILDHPHDGFTESGGTVYREADEREAAHAGPRIRQWMQHDAKWGVWGRPAAPSDVADIPSGSQTSVRVAFSAIVPVEDRGILKRWEAECAVTREEAEAEYRRFQALSHTSLEDLYAKRPDLGTVQPSA